MEVWHTGGGPGGIVEKVNTAPLLQTPSKFFSEPLTSFTILVVGNPEKKDSA
jgi:hypothetical protein